MARRSSISILSKHGADFMRCVKAHCLNDLANRPSMSSSIIAWTRSIDLQSSPSATPMRSLRLTSRSESRDYCERCFRQRATDGGRALRWTLGMRPRSVTGRSAQFSNMPEQPPLIRR
jgi:hypothetical protein